MEGRRLEDFDAAVGGWRLSEEEAEEIIAVSVSMPVTLTAETINLGAGGGNAPGAAGGGGAAIGPGSLGGPGGSVGHINLDGEAGVSPGAGGAGGGALAADAILPPPRSDSDPKQGRGWSIGTDGRDGGELARGLKAAADSLASRAAPIAGSYETVRSSMRAGPERTAAMEAEVARAREDARSGSFTAEDVVELFSNGTDGQRIYALGIMQEHPELAPF